jgi:ubiquinone biosynthesis protein UbiJ
MGIPGAVERLTRFIDMGDRTLARLVQARLGLSFLEKLRASLKEELARITGDLRAMPLGARP